MEGEVELESVYAERLRLLQPTRGDLQRIAMRYRARAVPDARELIAALDFLGRRVHIVSGGLAEPVTAFGDWLGVGADQVHAVGLEFNQLAGRWWEYPGRADNPAEQYLDFVSGPLSETQGKAAVIARMRRRPGRAMLVGDGISDLMARPAVELFVGFGGVAHRKRVASEADVYVASTSLAPVLPLVARPEEYRQCQGTPHQSLFDRGIALIAEGSVAFHHERRKESFHAAYQAFHPRADRGAA
jgi:phosphoserine phosphatase